MSPRMSTEDGAALYRIFDDAGVLIYVGVSLDPRQRLLQHKRGVGGGPDQVEVAARYHHADVSFYTTAADAFIAETEAIRTERPELNKRGHLNHRPIASVEDGYGAAVRAAAAEADVTICELAYRLDVDRRTLDRHLKTGNFNIAELEDVARILEVPLSTLIARAEVAA